MSKAHAEAAALALERLKRLFSDIDSAYAAAAHEYGFSCEGCGQTCCGEHFLHHTVVEQLLLQEGLETLDGGEREKISGRAEGTAALYLRMTEGGEGGPVLCPLFSGGRCLLYRYRPLICRLHGIPYDLGSPPVRGEGCHRFDSEIVPSGKPWVPFDRTAWFKEMADIEINLRRAQGQVGRIRKSVAGMVVEIGRDHREP